MRSNRVYVDLPLASQATLDLPAAAAHHLVTVLRARAGDSLQVFNERDGEFAAKVVTAHRRGASVELLQALPAIPAASLAITLIQGVARGERMDLIVQKAVELGVTCLQPVYTERTNVRLSSDREQRRVEHWQKVLVSACEQSGRVDLPRLERPVPLDLALSRQEGELALQLDPHDGRGLSSYTPVSRLALLVGPEGGLSQQERQAASRAGWQPLRLGPRVLRTETAGLAAISAVQACWGDFR